MLKKISLFKFSLTIYPNTPTVASEIIEGREYIYDNLSQEYPDSFKAFLQKRRLKKSEIRILKNSDDLFHKTSKKPRTLPSTSKTLFMLKIIFKRRIISKSRTRKHQHNLFNVNLF